MAHLYFRRVMQNKIWKDIFGYEGLYRISNYGDVFSLKSNKTLKPETLERGYLRIGLNKEGKRKRFLIHRLVMCAFVEYKDYPEYEVNHKDMNTQNNFIENLEWTTNKENSDHKHSNKPELKQLFKKTMSKIGKKYCHLGTEASKKKVERYTKDGDYVDCRDSAREYDELGFNYKNISQVCNGEKKTHRSFVFKFAE